MPSKKKKFNARFPPARIKKIMQTDDDVGKVAAAVPVIISRALELFMESLILKTSEVTQSKNAKTLTTAHIKETVLSEKNFDFLKDLVESVPDIQTEEDLPSSLPASDQGPSRHKAPRQKRKEGGRGPGRPRKERKPSQESFADDNSEPHTDTADEGTDADGEDEDDDDDDKPSEMSLMASAPSTSTSAVPVAATNSRLSAPSEVRPSTSDLSPNSTPLDLSKPVNLPSATDSKPFQFPTFECKSNMLQPKATTTCGPETSNSKSLEPQTLMETTIQKAGPKVLSSSKSHGTKMVSNTSNHKNNNNSSNHSFCPDNVTSKSHPSVSSPASVPSSVPHPYPLPNLPPHYPVTSHTAMIPPFLHPSQPNRFGSPRVPTPFDHASPFYPGVPNVMGGGYPRSSLPAGTSPLARTGEPSSIHPQMMQGLLQGSPYYGMYPPMDPRMINSRMMYPPTAQIFADPRQHPGMVPLPAGMTIPPMVSPKAYPPPCQSTSMTSRLNSSNKEEHDNYDS